ncbi:MAG: hypothetical protein WC683_05740 [bacterium]
MAGFRNSFQPDMASLWRYFQGRPTGPIGMRQSRQNNDLMRIYLQSETDPQIRAALERAINAGSFESAPTNMLALAGLSKAEQDRATSRTEQSQQDALRLLAADIGELPPDIAERFGVDAQGNNRMDKLQADVMRDIGLRRSGFEQQARREAMTTRARGGFTGESAQDVSAIANRGATIFGRQAGTELGGLRREFEGRRERGLGNMANILANTTYSPSNYGSLAELGQYGGGGGTIGRKTSIGGNRFGVGLRGGTARTGGYTVSPRPAKKKTFAEQMGW